MTDLSRNLLAAAREGLSPDAAIAARVRARVAATVGVPAALAPVKATATTGVLKVAGSLALLGVLAIALVALPRKTERPSAPQVTAPSVELDEPRAAVRVASAEPTVAAAPIVATSPRAVAPATLAREVELIDRAMLALKSGAAPAALDAIAIFERETQHHGQMAEDAAAIAIEAHCVLEHDVTARLAAFDRSYPSSAQRTRLQQTCR